MRPPRRVWSFLCIAFGLTWSIALAGALMGVRASSGLPFLVVAGACMLMPATAAIIQQRIIDKSPWGLLGLGFTQLRWKSLFFTALIGILFVPAVLLVVALLGNLLDLEAFGTASLSRERMLGNLETILNAAGAPAPTGVAMDLLNALPPALVLVLMLFVAVLAAATVNLPAMLGEELGWRGYLYQHLRAWPAARRVLFTGSIWGLWHAPLILMGHNYPAHPFAGAGLMVVFCVVLAVLFDHARMRVNAVWGPCLLHGIINGSAGAFALFVKDGHPLVSSPAGITGMGAVMVLALFVCLCDPAYRRLLIAGGEAGT